MAFSIEDIVRKAINTGNFTPSSGAGILSSEQARKFIQQTFDATVLGGLVRHEMRSAKAGEIDKIGIASRILREKTEDTDDGYRAGANTASIKYSCTDVRLPWEITEETLRENIEGQNLEAIITNLMTTQMGIDTVDLYLNGDEKFAKVKAFSTGTTYQKGDLVSNGGKVYEFTAQHSAGAWTGSDATELGTTGDADFLKVNDGWIKQLVNGAHVVDGQNAGMKLDTFYNAVHALPNKYNNGKLRWLMSPHRAQEWELSLLNKVIEQGGAVPESVYNSPVKIPVVECPSLDDDKIILTDPKNLIVVNTYNTKIRTTVEGNTAIMTDKRFYVVHFDFDAIIEELDAAAIITNIK